MFGSLKNNKKNCIVLALGFFDSVHYGHRKIISNAVEYAQHNGLLCCVSTFLNDPGVFFGKSNGQIYTYKERVQKLYSLGADDVIAFEFNEDFKNQTKDQFIKLLLQNYDVKKVFCGYDYTFGKGGEGNVEYLVQYFGKDNVTVFPKIEIDGKRVSTSVIKDLLLSGRIKEANQYLVEPFSIQGEIVKGRGEGHIYGFPTANLKAPEQKLIPKHGVYATFTIVDGKRFRSVTNIGSKPTFNISTDTIESLIVDFDGDLYGKQVELEFISYLRDTRAFNSPEDLKNQIYTDVKISEEIC